MKHPARRIRLAGFASVFVLASCSERPDSSEKSRDSPPGTEAASFALADSSRAGSGSGATRSPDGQESGTPHTLATPGEIRVESPLPDSTQKISWDPPEFLRADLLAAIPEVTLSREELIRLAPAFATLSQLGFLVPTAAPDTTGKKNRAKLQREWVDALVDYQAENWDAARKHLSLARQFYLVSTEPDPNWPQRIRNLDAACIYAIGAPGDVRRNYGEIAFPNQESNLDMAYLWILAADELRAGNAKEAVARLQLVHRSQAKANVDARKLLGTIQPNVPLGDPPAPHGGPGADNDRTIGGSRGGT